VPFSLGTNIGSDTSLACRETRVFNDDCRLTLVQPLLAPEGLDTRDVGAAALQPVGIVIAPLDAEVDLVRRRNVVLPTVGDPLQATAACVAARVWSSPAILTWQL